MIRSQSDINAQAALCRRQKRWETSEHQLHNIDASIESYKRLNIGIGSPDTNLTTRWFSGAARLIQS